MGQSRNEDILESIINGTEYTAPPQSRIEDLLLQLKQTIENLKSFSEDERVIGKWLDSKPLYEKTVVIESLPGTPYETVEYPHNIQNIDTICDSNGVVRWASGQIAKFDRGAFFENEWDANSCCLAEVDKTYIKITTGADRSNMSAFFTIRYTKTEEEGE